MTNEDDRNSGALPLVALIVDEQARMLLAAAFLNSGFRVVTCQTPYDAKTALTALTISVAVIDPEFGGGAGLAIAGEYNKPDLPNHPVIVFLLPADPRVPHFVQDYDPRRIGFLTEPFAAGEIEASIQRIKAML
jgi:DNA-binding NtrC family response regulator